MEDHETPAAVPAPKKKRKVKKARAKTPAAAKPVKAEGVYVGMTVSMCCKGCNAEACVISQQPYCAHPRKGGLQAHQMQDQSALRRLREAQRVLGEQLLDARMG